MKRLYSLIRLQVGVPKGLTLTEVMVSMLISGLSLSTAMQAYVSAVGFSAKSQISDVALTSITTDLETIRQWANERPVTPTDCQLQPPLPGGYAQKLMTRVAAQDAVTLSQFGSPSPNWEVSAIEQQGQTLMQSSTLPIASFVNSYEINRRMVAQASDLVAPPNVVQITYEVVNTATQAPMAQLHTAVMPNAALVCP